MSWRQPNRAPAGCLSPRCAHVDELTVKGDPADRCRKGKPMHDGCGWHETPEQVAVKAARDQSLLVAAQQPMNRRSEP